MTRQNDIERLARFMGWKKGRPGGERCWVRVSDGGCFPHGWDPFTRLDDAMMVADKMMDKDFDFELSVCCDDREWVGRFRECPEDSQVDYRGDSKNKAEAIALAALAYLDAVGFR